ncbi:MAG: ketoacyl-ACP synthase III [Spirochaetaceae bacterium]|nr:MAG: ketoacyl-ACP synthase III [Spirochaetaceae bacterium]
MKTGITALACYVPDRVVTNDELSRTVDTSDEWIVSHTGIRERRLAAPGVSASDLGVEAGRRVLEQRGIGADEIDLVIVATSTPDYAPFPASACVVQERLGCSRAGAFDLQAGCTGFVYALEAARSFVTAGSFGRVLVIGSEVLSSITNWSDRNSCVLFGDGAGAAIVESLDAVPGHEIRASWLRSDGAGETALMRRIGGSRVPFDPAVHTAEDFFLTMDGKRVYLFAVDAIVRSIRSLCETAGLTPADVDWIVPHQANLRIIEAAAKRLGLPVERFYTNLDRYANTSAASIPIAIEEMVGKGLLSPGQTMLTVGFGAGLTYGGNLIRW